jgi:glycosyltransferase involved in cell wall biosynthesis
MKQTAVPMTREEFSSGRTHVVWDSDLPYSSMLRWAPGGVVPIDGWVPTRRAVGVAARVLSKLGDRSRTWKRSSPRRWLRDVGQVQSVRVPPGTEVLYGHIVFPVTSPALPTVWSTNGVFDARPGLWFPEQSAKTHARMISRAAAVQCWSEAGKAGLLERLPDLDGSTIEVLPPLAYLDLPEPWPRPHADPVAIFVGANGALKGVDVVIEAARLVPDLRVEIVTHSPQPPALPPSVEWLGPRSHAEVLARLRSSSIHVFPSTTESLGGVVIEALAAGVAQIVDAGSVTAEVAGAGGLTVDGRVAEAVATALRRLAEDDGLRDACAAAGRARYEAHYSPEAVGPRLERLIDSV